MATVEQTPVHVGVDIGQVHDPTAVVIAEIIRVAIESRQRTCYQVHQVERLPLNTSYPEVAERLATILCHPRLKERQVKCFFDITGVGRPVYDDLRRRIEQRKPTSTIALRPITFTAGERYNKLTGATGKGYMVSRLQALLQNDLLHMPHSREMNALRDELKTYERKMTVNGADSYNAVGGHHDDMATALGLACLEDPYSSGAGILIDLTPDPDADELIPTSHYGEMLKDAEKIDWW